MSAKRRVFQAIARVVLHRVFSRRLVCNRKAWMQDLSHGEKFITYHCRMADVAGVCTLLAVGALSLAILGFLSRIRRT